MASGRSAGAPTTRRLIYAACSWRYGGSLGAPSDALAPALIRALLTLIAPFFVMQPSMGAGIAASKTPIRTPSRLRSLVAHTVWDGLLARSSLGTSSGLAADPKLSMLTIFLRTSPSGRFRCAVFGARTALILDHADEGQFAEGVGDVHAVADDEQVGADEADVIGLERLRRACPACRAAPRSPTRRAPRFGISSLAKAIVRPGFEDVVDEQDVAAGDVALDIADDASPCRSRPCRSR